MSPKSCSVDGLVFVILYVHLYKLGLVVDHSPSYFSGSQLLKTQTGFSHDPKKIQYQGRQRHLPLTASAQAVILGSLDHPMHVCTDICRQTFPIHRNQAPSFSLRHLTESIEYQNHWGKFPNYLFGCKLQDKHFICRWLRAFLPLSRLWLLQQLGLVYHYIAPAQEDQRANINQWDSEREQILHWQWNCSKGNTISHEGRRNFAV